MSMTSSATPASSKPEDGRPQVVSLAGSAPYRRPWANMMTSATPALDCLRHTEPGPLGGVQRNERRADQGPDGDCDQRPPERQPDRDGDGAHDDVEHVDVAAEPERELVPGLAVPRRG